MELWRGFIEEQAGGHAERSGRNCWPIRRAFAKFARQMISDLGYGDQLGDDPDQPEEDQDDESVEQEEQDDQPESTGFRMVRINPRTKIEAEPPEQSQEEQTQDAAEAQVSMDDLADMELSEEAELPEGDAPLEPPPPASPFGRGSELFGLSAPISTKKSLPRNWPNPPNWSACAPIWTSNWNR